MYLMVCKVDPKNHAKVLGERFSTEDEAINRACGLLASGEAFECELRDDRDEMVINHVEVQERCKA
jgi:hypothetical protein